MCIRDRHGAHPSAETPKATAALRKKALEKVNQNFAKLIPWRKIRKQLLRGLHKNTKVSPIAAIPHKSRLFRMILDLSRKGQRRNSTATAVNELTDIDAAPRHSMDQLGSVLGRIIYILGDESTDPEPILFCKLDIKDGFWRMVVPNI